MTANLQKHPTVREMAKAAGISERALYLARRLRRSGRTDLIAAVERDELKLYEAVRIADGRPKPTRFDKLVTVWLLCSDEDRARFIRLLRDRDDEAANSQGSG
jgi:hypothetical protein